MPANHLPRTLVRSRGILKIFGVFALLLMITLLALPTPAALGRSADPRVVTWTGKGGDSLWSNPANWDTGHIPGASDIARFAASSSNAIVDPKFAGTLSGLELDAGYEGTLRLERSLFIKGDLAMHSGKLYAGVASLWVDGAARVSGGLLITPRTTMRVDSMDIQSPGVVRMGANGRLDLAGDGTPLTGTGLLDMTTNRPNSVQYTGHATNDLDTAGPVAALRALNVSKNDVQRLVTARATASARKPQSPLFSEAGISLTLNTGEDILQSAVIDTANGFAYFGTYTLPGIVVKVNLSTFTRVGALSLNTGEDLLSSAAIDTANGFAYFGTGTLPGKVVKIRLSNFTRVGALTLNAGEDFLTSAVIDPGNGFAYFGTANLAPGTVVKVALNGTLTPTRNSAITLNAGEDWLNSAVIDTANGFAYFGATDITNITNTGHIAKVALSPTFTRTAGLTLNLGENSLGSAVIDTSNGFAYFGTANDAGNSIPANIVKVQLSSMTRIGALQPFDIAVNQVSAGVIDAARGFAYFASNSQPSIIAKVQLSPSFTTVQTITLGTNEDFAASAVIDPANNYAYFGLGIAPGAVARVLLNNSQTTVTSSANPSVFGQSVTFTATVSPLGQGGTPTGIVTFTLDAGPSVTRTLSGGTATYTPAAPAVGTHIITATYGGDGTFTASSGTLTQIVNKAGTTTSVTSAPNPSVFGQSVTFTATVAAVSPGAGTPTGVVTFTFDGGTNVTRTLSGGVATYVTSTLSVAAHSVAGNYGGDGNFNTSSGSLPTQTVNKASTTTTITSDLPDPSVTGQSVPITFTVTANPPGAGTPTGVVTVTDGVQTCVATLPATSCSIAFSTAGAKTLTAQYGGDTSFTGSTSASVGHTVNKASTTTTITSDLPDPSVTGQSVPITFTVTANPPGAGTPTGVVTVTDGVQSCVATLPATSCSIAFSTIGAKTLTAQYGGDANFTGSTSASVGHTVSPASTTTTITSDLPDPSVTGQSVPITFTVTVNPPGAGTPTGVVTVTDGVQTCVATLPATSCSIAFSTAGAKTLTAQYGGDTNFTGSTSASVGHTVDKASTTTAIASIVPSPALFGQPTTITASLTVNAPGAGTPTGTITITDGNQLCTATLPATSCSIAFTTLGTRTITATYAGDANFNTSAGTSPLTVNDVPITVVTAANSSPTRLDDTTYFTATSNGTNVTFAWNFGDGSPVANGANVTHTYSISATFTAIVTATNTNNSLSTTTPVTITNQRPVAVAFDNSFSLGSIATLDGSFSFDPDNHLPLTYHWTQTGGSAVIFTPNLSVTTFTAPSSPTVLTFTLTVTDAHNLPSLAHTVVITIADIPITGLAAQNSSPTAFGVATQFTATVTTGSSVAYTWNFGDGITTTGQFVAHTYAALGSYTAHVTATNSLGSFSTTTPVTITKATPVVAITSHTPNPSVVGESVTINFSVTPPGVGTPTGTVTVTAGTQSCSASVATGFCTITFTSPGGRTLTAQYSGDTNFNGATSAGVSHTVNPASTSTSVTSSPNPSVFGQSVTFTATVVISGAGAGTPTGTVNFFDGVTNIGSGALNASGIATLSTSALAVGLHGTITAQYGGDTNFNGSTSSAYSHTVNKASTTTSVTSTPNPSVFGQSVTFTATVLAVAPGAGTRTGTVTFFDGATSLGTGAVNASGIATLSTSALAVGAHSTITATYSGDGSFNGSTSSAYVHTVNKADTTTTVVSSLNPSIISQSVTFTATVAAAAPGVGTPTGTVTFTIDGVTVSTPTLSGGVATFTTSSLTPGTHTVAVTYGGDTNFNSSGSSTLNQSVSQYHIYLPLVRR
jgi:adenosine/AMP kinase